MNKPRIRATLDDLASSTRPARADSPSTNTTHGGNTMKMQRLAALATAAALALTGLAVAAGPAEATAKTGVVDYDSHQVKVKPKRFQPYKDLYFSNVHWTRLTSTTGYATGAQNENTCIPDCAHANYKRIKVTLKFTNVKHSNGHRVFSRVKATEIKSKRTHTWKLPV